jgi:hypothetical protein
MENLNEIEGREDIPALVGDVLALVGEVNSQNKKLDKVRAIWERYVDALNDGVLEDWEKNLTNLLDRIDEALRGR